MPRRVRCGGIAVRKEKKIKPKKCKNPSCRATFTPPLSRPLQAVCGPKCAGEWAAIQRKKREADEERMKRRELKAAKEKIKGKPELLQEAEDACNAFIRYRDRKEPCISCGKFSASGYYDAGHYRAKSLQPALRFHEDNIHKQCVECNQHLHANLAKYRPRLIEKIGIEKVLWLDMDHPLPHWTHEEIRQIRDGYRLRLREAKKIAN